MSQYFTGSNKIPAKTGKQAKKGVSKTESAENTKTTPESKHSTKKINNSSKQWERGEKYTPQRNASKNVKYAEESNFDSGGNESEDEYKPQSKDQGSGQESESDESDQEYVSVEEEIEKGTAKRKKDRTQSRKVESKGRKRSVGMLSQRLVGTSNMLSVGTVLGDGPEQKKPKLDTELPASFIASIGKRPNLSESESSDSESEIVQTQSKKSEQKSNANAKSTTDSPILAKRFIATSKKLTEREVDKDALKPNTSISRKTDSGSEIKIKRKRGRSTKSNLGKKTSNTDTINIKLELKGETLSKETTSCALQTNSSSNEVERGMGNNGQAIKKEPTDCSFYDLAVPGPSGYQNKDVGDEYKMDSSSDEQLSDSDDAWEDVDEVKLPKHVHLESPNKKVKHDNKDVEIRLKVSSIHQSKRKNRQEKYMKYIEQAVRRFQRETQVNIHKVHLLCLVAHCQIVNKLCNGSDLQALHLSLVPKHITRVPNNRWDLTHLPRVVHWFQTEVPPVQSLLAVCDQVIPSTGCLERIHMLVSMLRALGFLVRIIVSLQPLSPKVKFATKTPEGKRKSKEKNDIKDKKSKESEVDTPKRKKETSEKKKETPKKKKDTATKNLLATKSETDTDNKRNFKDTVAMEKSPYFLSKKQEGTPTKLNKVTSVTQKLKQCGRNKTTTSPVDSKVSKSDKVQGTNEEALTQVKISDTSKRKGGKAESDDKQDTRKGLANYETESLHEISDTVKTRKRGVKSGKETQEDVIDKKESRKSENRPQMNLSSRLSKSETPNDCTDKHSSDGSASIKEPRKQKQVNKRSKLKALTVDTTESGKGHKTLRKRKRVSYADADETGKDSDDEVEFKEEEISSSEDDFEVRSPKHRTPRKSTAKSSKQRKSTTGKTVDDNRSGNKNETEKKGNPRGSSKQGSKQKNLEEDNDSVFEKTNNSVKKVSGSKKKADKQPQLISSGSEDNENHKRCASEGAEVRTEKGIDHWLEIYLPSQRKWICVELTGETVNRPERCEAFATKPLQYVIGIDNDGAIKDVTCRYASKWLSQTRKLRIDREWWAESLEPYQSTKEDYEKEEDAQLRLKLLQQPLPTSIAEIKGHPLYVIEEHLLKFEALYPPTAAVLGFIRGKPVYSRDCVHTLHSRENWLKEARVIKKDEQPYKIVKGRPRRNTPAHERDNVKLGIYGIWQTEEYKPPPAKDGKVPRNEYGNLELFKACMLPPGTVHIPIQGIHKTARKLGIDAAPAMMGWDFHGGFAHPIIEGVVVCKEFEDKLMDAWAREEEEYHRRQREKREKKILDRWKLLVKGLLVRERLRRKYDFENMEDSNDSSLTKDDSNVTDSIINDVSVSWPLNRLDGTASLKEEGHCHVFPESSHKQDSITGEWTKSCSCGLTLPYEKL